MDKINTPHQRASLMVYAICLFVLFSLTACNVSLRNPSAINDAPFFKALPENVMGDFLLTYYGADEASGFGTIYENGEEVLFIFGEDGSLSSTIQAILIDEDYEIKGREFIWIDEENDLKFALSIDRDGVGSLKISDIAGDIFYGQFNIVSKNPDTNSNSNANSNVISGQEDGAEPSLLPGIATGRYDMIYTDSQPGSPFGDGDKLRFSFFSAGALRIGEQMLEIDDQFEVRDDEFVWEFPTFQIEYALILTDDDEVAEVIVYSMETGNYLGMFASPEKLPQG